jgi:twitching motility protein PilJ
MTTPLFSKPNQASSSQISSLTESSLLQEEFQPETLPRSSWQLPWGRQTPGVRAKAIALAVALSVVPVLAIGGTATYFANQVITQRTLEEKERVATAISLRLNEFVRGRLQDVQTIANAPFVTSPAVRDNTPPNAIIKYFDTFVTEDPSYAQIVAITPDGAYAFLENGKGFRTTKGVYLPEDDRPGVKAFADKNIPFYLIPRNTLRPATIPLRVSISTGKSAFYVAIPAFDASTKKLAYVIYSRTDAPDISNIINGFVANLDGENAEGSSESLQFRAIAHEKAYYEKTSDGMEAEIPSNRIEISGNSVTIDGQAFSPGGNFSVRENRIFVSNQDDGLGTAVESVFPKYVELRQAGVAGTAVDVSRKDGKEYLLTYVPIPPVNNLSFDWGVLISQPTSEVFAPQRTLNLALLLGTAITAVVVGAIAAAIANRVTRPILTATAAVEKIGAGELDTRIPIQGKDELALLGVNINRMAEQIKNLLYEQATLTEEQRRQKEALQERALELLEEVDPINEGDLTVRARVTEDDIGTIADAYNATVTNLREIVEKVQSTSTQVSDTTKDSARSIQILSKEALHQAEKISQALDQVKQMAQSARLVAANAEKAATVVQQANQTVQEGDQAMNRTVRGINTIRETVAEARQKVKYLGESSQQITNVVKLINSFASQTKLVAFNASMEANRAGEAGRGFSVVADEVRSLAQQSAEATNEIEKLVTRIQAETNEVIAAMETGTEQVVHGTNLVEETRQSLNKVTAASGEISKLVSAISQATVKQSVTSDSVTQTMGEVAEIANRTYREADRVTTLFQELEHVAEELKQDAGRFKVR